MANCCFKLDLIIMIFKLLLVQDSIYTISCIITCGFFTQLLLPTYPPRVEQMIPVTLSR